MKSFENLYKIIQDISSSTRSDLHSQTADRITSLQKSFEEIDSEQGISETKAKNIANAISNITGFSIRKYGYNLGDLFVPLIINDSEEFLLNDTGGNKNNYYPLINGPFEIKVNGAIDPKLNNGEYFYLYYQIDNSATFQKLFKTFDNDLIGTFNISAYFQLQKQNFGSDLVIATPYNVEYDNQTDEDIQFAIQGTYYNELVENDLISTEHYQRWDYVYPRYTVNLTNSSKNLEIELWTANMIRRVYRSFAYKGNNYVNGYMGQCRQSSYGTRDYKVIVKYQ